MERLKASRTTVSLEDNPKDAPLFVWALGAAVLLMAVLAAPCLLGSVYTHDDLGAFHLPLRDFYAEQLGRAEPFDWMPQLFCGFYLTGEGQAGTYHPLHLMLYRLLPLSAAWSCEILLGYAFMLAGTYFFLRRRAGRAGAMFGATVFTFSGFNAMHLVHPNAIAVVAHIPWLLWSIDRLAAKPPRNRLVSAQIGIALLTGSQLLLGYPQYVWFSLLAEAAYGLFLMLSAGASSRSEKGDTRDKPPFLRGIPQLPFVGRFLVAKGLGVMVAAVQLLPTIESLGSSTRASTGAAFANSWSLAPVHLTQFVSPYFFTHRNHEFGFYVGAVPLMLVVWLLGSGRHLARHERLFAWAVGGFGLIAMWLAMGRFGGIYRVQRLIPIVGGFRCPSRYAVLMTLCVAVLAAIAMVLLARRQARGEATAWAELKPLAWTVAVAGLVAAIGWYRADLSFIASPGPVLAGLLLMGGAAVLVALAARGYRGTLPVLMLFTACDLGAYCLTQEAYQRAEPLEQYVAQIGTPPGKWGRVLEDMPQPGGLAMRTGSRVIVAGWPRADGYVGLEPVRRLDFRDLAALRAAGVRWVRRREPAAELSELIGGNEHWLEVPEPLERVRLVTRVEQTQDPAPAIRKIPLDTTALVEVPVALGGGTPGTATIVRDLPGRIDVGVECGSSQLLLITESYHSGWTARVDGRSRAVVRANGDFLGCVVREGEHRVEFCFRPASLRAGCLVSVLGLGLLVVLPRLAIEPIRRKVPGNRLAGEVDGNAPGAKYEETEAQESDVPEEAALPAGAGA